MKALSARVLCHLQLFRNLWNQRTDLGSQLIQSLTTFRNFRTNSDSNGEIPPTKKEFIDMDGVWARRRRMAEYKIKAWLERILNRLPTYPERPPGSRQIQPGPGPKLDLHCIQTTCPPRLFAQLMSVK